MYNGRGRTPPLRSSSYEKGIDRLPRCSVEIQISLLGFLNYLKLRCYTLCTYAIFFWTDSLEIRIFPQILAYPLWNSNDCYLTPPPLNFPLISSTGWLQIFFLKNQISIWISRNGKKSTEIDNLQNELKVPTNHDHLEVSDSLPYGKK